MTIDYKELLRKYIDHVSACEGVDFIGRIRDDHWSSANTKFTDAEYVALCELGEFSPDELAAIRVKYGRDG